MYCTKFSALAVAVSSVLSGAAFAGHEIVGDSKKQIVETPGPVLTGEVSAGYWSKYIFRGTNLTPGSDGLIWAQGYLSVHPWEHGTFTFGVWAGSQQGQAEVNGTERIGEAGGAGVPATLGERQRDLGGITSGGASLDEATRKINSVYARNLTDPNGVSGKDFINYLKDEFAVLGAPNGQSFIVPGVGATPDRALVGPLGTGTNGNAYLSNQDIRDLVRAATGRGIPDQLTKFKTTTDAVQERFTEIDATAEYRHDFGPIELAIGNIFFYIDRQSKANSTVREFFASDTARDFINNMNFDQSRAYGTRVVAPVVVVTPGRPQEFLLNNGNTVKFSYASTGDEAFDRGYVDLSTNLLTSYYGIKPHLTYYQTFYSEGEEGDSALTTKRYDTKGGYAEFKVAASIPLWKVGTPGATDYKSGKATVGDEKVKLSLDPSFRVSYSVRDRASEDGTPLTGFNHLQLGAQLTWHITDTFSIVPEINYARHLAPPTPGTERDEVWGGGRAEVTF